MKTAPVHHAARRRGGCVAARGARAAAERVPQIGFLSPVSAASGFLARDEMFRQGLRELGYVDGTNIVIEYRFADGQFDRLPALAAELVQLKVDVIVTAVTQAVSGSTGCHKDNPDRHCGRLDPVGSGLSKILRGPAVTSPAHPSRHLRWSENRWNCSKRSFPGLCVLRHFGIRQTLSSKRKC